MIGEGMPIPAVAESFGVTRQAFYMRRSRDAVFDLAVMRAEASAHLKMWRALLQAIEDGSKTWVGYATILQRKFGFLSPVDEAKARQLNASAADQIEQQKKLRAFVESVQNAEEGDPGAVLPDDMRPGDDEEDGGGEE